MTCEKKKFNQMLLALVLPITFQNLMSALVSASDALMLGFLTQDTLSAVALAGQVQFVLNLFLGALTIGETVLAALGMPRLLMRIFTPDTCLIEFGAVYLRIVSWSYLFTGFSQVFLCIMKNSGRTLRSTIYGSVAAVLNIALNALLIFGLCGFPALGIAGAALATTLSRGVELLLVLIENVRGEFVCLRFSRLLERNKALWKDFLHCTASVQANMLAWGCGLTMISVILGRLGSDAVAANALAAIAKNIAVCVCLGISSASGIIVGNALGSGDLEQARRYGRRLCHVSLAFGAAAGAALAACIPLVMLAAGNLTPTAQAYLKGMLIVCAAYLPAKAINGTVISGIFCAGGNTRFGFLCDTITMWGIVIPLGLLAAFVWHLPVLVVYLVLSLDEFVKLPVVYRNYKKYKWVKNLTRD